MIRLELIVGLLVIALSRDILLCSFRIEIVALHLWLFTRDPLLLLNTIPLHPIHILPVIPFRRATFHEGSLDVLSPHLHSLHLELLSLRIVQGDLDHDFRLFFSKGESDLLLTRIGRISFPSFPLRTGRVLAVGAEDQTGAYPLGRHLEFGTASASLLLLGRGLVVNGLGGWNAVVLGDVGLLLREGVLGSVVLVVLEGESFGLDLLDLGDCDGFKWNGVVFSEGLGLFGGETVAGMIEMLL